MPRPLTGRIVERKLSDGTKAYYAVVRDVYQLLGHEPHWSYGRAATELRDRIIPRAKLGEDWRAPYRAPELSAPAGDEFDPATLAFHGAASDYLSHLKARHRDNANTENAYASPVLKHLLPFFAYRDDARREPYTLLEISAGYLRGTSRRYLVEDFIAAKHAEREELIAIRASLAAGHSIIDLTAREQLLVRRYGQQHSRYDKDKQERVPTIWSLSSKGVSDSEINRCLRRLDDIFRRASKRHGVEFGQPGREHLLKVKDSKRDWLRPDHVQAILDAAMQLDREAGRYSNLGRYEMMATLAFAGPRVSELAAIRVRDLDVPGRVLEIPQSKTGAGEREIFLSDFLCALLAARVEGLGLGPDALLFATNTGRRRDRNSVRNRMLNPVLDRARKLLAERGQRRLPARVTCHTFRRTFLTCLAWKGEPTRFAMDQAGHKDAKLTLEIYQQSFDPYCDPRVHKWLARPERQHGPGGSAA